MKEDNNDEIKQEPSPKDIIISLVKSYINSQEGDVINKDDVAKYIESTNVQGLKEDEINQILTDLFDNKASIEVTGLLQKLNGQNNENIDLENDLENLEHNDEKIIQTSDININLDLIDQRDNNQFESINEDEVVLPVNTIKIPDFLPNSTNKEKKKFNINEYMKNLESNNNNSGNNNNNNMESIFNKNTNSSNNNNSSITNTKKPPKDLYKENKVSPKVMRKLNNLLEGTNNTNNNFNLNYKKNIEKTNTYMELMKYKKGDLYKKSNKINEKMSQFKNEFFFPENKITFDKSKGQNFNSNKSKLKNETNNSNNIINNDKFFISSLQRNILSTYLFNNNNNVQGNNNNLNEKINDINYNKNLNLINKYTDILKYNDDININTDESNDKINKKYLFNKKEYDFNDPTQKKEYLDNVKADIKNFEDKREKKLNENNQDPFDSLNKLINQFEEKNKNRQKVNSNINSNEVQGDTKNNNNAE